MQAGDSKPKLLILQTAAGVNYSYADKASFQAGGWDLIWRDVNGTALTSQPVWTIADEGNGLHRVKYAQPAGVYWVEITVPGTAYVTPATWMNEGEAYDNDAIAGLLLTNQGVPAVISADDGTLGDVVNTDSWSSSTLFIPVGKLTPFGKTFADLASGWTITAGLKKVPTDTMVPITCAFVDTTTGAFKASWTTFPAAMDLGTAEQAQWYLDIQIVETATHLCITTNRYALRVVWERDTVAP